MSTRSILTLILIGSLSGCSSSVGLTSLSGEDVKAICEQDGYMAGKNNLPYDGACQSVNPQFVAQYQLGQANKPSPERHRSQSRSINVQDRTRSM